jgi:hypothetical protein
MFTLKQLKTIKKVIKDEERTTANKKDATGYDHDLILATERLQEIYKDTCCM